MKDRFLSFPEAKSVGALEIWDADDCDSDHESFGEAQGMRRIPAGKAVELFFAESAADNLAFLESYVKTGSSRTPSKLRVLYDVCL